MALITCPECSREVSDQAVACPHCGYPLRAKSAPASPALGDADTRILQALQIQGKIAAIKLCRELHPEMGLAVAKEYVERLETTLPATSRAPVSGSGCLLLLAALLPLAAGYGLAAFR